MSDNKITHSNVFDFTRSIEYSSDGIVSKQIIKNPGGNITLFAFDEGQELSEHSAPFDALVQVLEGEAEIMIDGTLYRVGSGSSVILPANHPHAVKAPGSFKMLLTMVRG
ncbi:MAG TPA: cupin domain-containing protein [Bacteroidales bacterium]|nr:cupin domain-containing protein [Bacteroidales bacterium]